MDEPTITRILETYGYRDFTLLPMQKGYRNESHPFELKDGQILNFMLFKQEQGSLQLIRNADRTSLAAAQAGLPARQPVSEQIVKLRAGPWHKYGRVYGYLSGHTIPWEAYTQGHIKQLGKSLSDLHAVLGMLPTEHYPSVAEQYLAQSTRMQTYFSQVGVTHALRAKLGLSFEVNTFAPLTRVLLASKQLQHQQVLHMDFVRSNILFDETSEPTISGILDFEKTAVGHPTFDVARTLAFLLVDCKYKTEDQVRKYFLQSGYVKRGEQPYFKTTIRDQGTSNDLLETLISLFLLYDFYKFLRHNPYESLPENEHFTRTRDFLIKQGALRRQP